ncbi:TPR repeat-containing protein YrrB [Mariprofundus micogutta]|uniref:TPR repeat-containing protein YrrB n=1 Tax=Mariprofundus micogutta TaxID=1921010 RepID=A0A1L8CJW4_9PROT|nr:sulfotransferase family protein [Mariprofundus micogutta]GAV19208.1 TPR repeat-containing protein YrrB [Mariprofundus micogutta]
MFFSKPKQPSPEQIQQLTQLFALGELEELIEEANELARKFPKTAQIHNILSVAYNATGDYHAAVDSAERATQIQPDYAKAFLNQGNALANLGEDEEALNSYRQAVLIAPDFAEGYNNLGAFLLKLQQHEEAAKSFTIALEIKTDYIKAHNNLGCALMELGRYEEAITNFESAIALNPDYAEAYNNMGGALLDTGRKQDAIDSFSRAIELNPHSTEAHRQLAGLLSFASDNRLYADMKVLYRLGELTDTQRMHLCFALAKAEDDMGNVEQSFDYLKEGNQLRKVLSGYSLDADRELFRQIKSAFSMTIQQQPVTETDNTHTPIFILGMPRSGTTLVEQILCSHSKVHGAGEVAILDHGINSIEWNKHGIHSDQLQNLRQHYLSWMESLDVSEDFITDKATINFRWIGFILQSMPEARIIHIKRDARATCWSAYKHFFGGDALGFSCDLDDVSEYYKLYVDLMDFWELHFPGRIHHINYESLTESQEDKTRKLLDYCGLDWEEQCMDFHLSGRAVATASNEQVRQKMYQGSSEAWHTFETHLEPMLRQLKDY